MNFTRTTTNTANGLVSVDLLPSTNTQLVSSEPLSDTLG